MIGINLNNEISPSSKKIYTKTNLNKSSDKKKKKRKNLIEKQEKMEKSLIGKNIKNVNGMINNFPAKNNDSSLSIIRFPSLKEENNNENETREGNMHKIDNFYDKKNISDKNVKHLIQLETKIIDNTNPNQNSKDNLLNFESIQKSTQFSQNISNINSHIIKHYGTNDFCCSKNKKRINNGFSCFKDPKSESANFGADTNEYNDKENKDNISSETVKISINKKVNSLIDSDSLKEKKELNYLNENSFINDEIYENEIFDLSNEYIDDKDDLLKKKNIIKAYLNNNIKIETLSRKILEKTWLYNLNNEKINYLEKLLNKPKIQEINNDSKNGSQYDSSTCKSWILNISNVESFKIKSSYENINEITSNKYLHNNELRTKTKEFLLKECFYDNENCNKKYGSKISSDFNFFRNIINDKRNTIINQMKESDRINKSDSIQRNSEKNKNIKKIKTRSSMPNFKFENNKKKSKIFRKEVSLKNLSNVLLPNIKKGKNFRMSAKNLNCKQETLNKSCRQNDEKEMSFYDKYNICNLNYDKYDNIDEKPSKKRKKLDSELDEIKQIIKQDAQNLNHPSLYYHNLFLNQIQRKQNYNKTLLPTINKNVNNINLNLRRISTSMDQNDFNKKVGVSFKRNNQKSCVNVNSKLKKI